MNKKITAIVPAAGVGKRFGTGTNKPFALLQDKPLVTWSLEVLESLPEITEIIPVFKEADMQSGAQLFEDYHISKIRRIAPGGTERQDSVLNGLRLVEDKNSLVLIHDGVRPFIEPRLIGEATRQLTECEGVVVGVPSKDTIKEINEGFVLRTLRRDILWLIQTPQIFLFEAVYEAYEKARAEAFFVTDDSALVEKYGGRIKVVKGSYSNIKITTPEDLAIAEIFLKMRKTGQ